MTRWLTSSKLAALLVVILLSSGCASISKDIYVMSDGGDVTITYVTSSDTDVDATDLLDATIPFIP